MIGFNRILGHENIVHSLKNSIIGERVNHAYIFSGEKGIGKHTLAKAFAKTLNCRNGGTEPCGQCISCKTLIQEIIRILLLLPIVKEILQLM